jgi:hypothetical protein
MNKTNNRYKIDFKVTCNRQPVIRSSAGSHRSAEFSRRSSARPCPKVQAGVPNVLLSDEVRQGYVLSGDFTEYIFQGLIKRDQQELQKYFYASLPHSLCTTGSAMPQGNRRRRR